MKNIFPKFAQKQLSTYVALIVIFVYNNVLDRRMECGCTEQSRVRDCTLYMLLPCLILIGLHLGMDKSFSRICTYKNLSKDDQYFKCCPKKCDQCFKCCPKKCDICCPCMSVCCSVYSSRPLKALLVGGLWIVSLLVDGDWYVCCFSKPTRPHLACKDPKYVTDDEREVIAEMKSRSRNWGFGLLLGIICVFVLMSCEWRRCCGDTSDCCNKRFLYEELILEEEENVLREILTKAAKEHLTTEIQEKIQNVEEWRKCYGAAANLIKNLTPPKITRGEAEQQTDGARRVDRGSDQDEVSRGRRNQNSGEISKDVPELQELIQKKKVVSERGDPGT